MDDLFQKLAALGTRAVSHVAKSLSSATVFGSGLMLGLCLTSDDRSLALFIVPVFTMSAAIFALANMRALQETSFGKASVTVALLTGIPLCLDSNNDIPTGDKVQQYLKNYFVSMLIVAIAHAHSTPLGIQKSASYMPSVEDKDPAATDSSMSDRSSLASPPRDYPDHDSLDFKHMPGPASYRSNSSNGTVISDISLSSGEHLVPSTLVLKITAQYVMVQTTPNRERSDSTMTAGEPDTE